MRRPMVVSLACKSRLPTSQLRRLVVYLANSISYSVERPELAPNGPRHPVYWDKELPRFVMTASRNIWRSITQINAPLTRACGPMKQKIAFSAGYSFFLQLNVSLFCFQITKRPSTTFIIDKRIVKELVGDISYFPDDNDNKNKKDDKMVINITRMRVLRLYRWY